MFYKLWCNVDEMAELNCKGGAVYNDHMITDYMNHFKKAAVKSMSLNEVTNN